MQVLFTVPTFLKNKSASLNHPADIRAVETALSFGLGEDRLASTVGEIPFVVCSVPDETIAKTGAMFCVDDKNKEVFVIINMPFILEVFGEDFNRGLCGMINHEHKHYKQWLNGDLSFSKGDVIWKGRTYKKNFVESCSANEDVYYSRLPWEYEVLVEMLQDAIARDKGADPRLEKALKTTIENRHAYLQSLEKSFKGRLARFLEKVAAMFGGVPRLQ